MNIRAETHLRFRRDVVVGVALFVIALALRLYRMDAQSLWLDEGGTWVEVTGRTGKGWLVLFAELFSADASYPLYHLILKAWVSIAGDSEWALRFPSALAGAFAVVVLYRIWSTSHDYTIRPPTTLPFHVAQTIVVGLLYASSPYALWHAQDAKAYSMLLLVICLLIWALLRLVAKTHQPWRAWLVLGIVALVSLFVHRLAILAVAGALLALALTQSQLRIWMRGGLAVLAVSGAALGVSGVLRVVATERAFAGRGLLGPLDAGWLAFVRFSLDRAPGDVAGYLGMPTIIWLLPALVLTLWGLVVLLRRALHGDVRSIVILCMALVPLALLILIGMLSPVFEPRYAMIAFPGWLMVIAAGGMTRPAIDVGASSAHKSRQSPPRLAAYGWMILATGLLFSNVMLLFQPHKGLYSGDALKEQWREAVQDVAWRVHPDDLLLIHPYYVANMYAYYAPRVTRDRLPQPITFPVFAQGDTCGASDPAAIRTCWQRRYEPFFKQAAEGHKRALLLIAPDHARTVDPPKSLAELRAETPVGQVPPTDADRYGWVGLRFQYPQKTWPCGGTGDALVGVEVMCQSFPETFTAQVGVPGNIPQPTVPLDILFGGEILFRGFTLLPHGGVFQAGGALPITLYWAAAQRPSHDYRMFVHLCQDCEQPPVANDDGPPLSGFAPAGLTTTWLPGDPLHDERVLRLPANLSAGRYTLLLGVYANDQRLPMVGAAHVLGANRLVLGEIEVQR